MSEERRRELSSLSFSEKIKILEKLRTRSLVLAEARKTLAQKKRQAELDWSNCGLVEGDTSTLKGTQLPAEKIISSYENGLSISEISGQFGIALETIKTLLDYVEQQHCLIHPE